MSIKENAHGLCEKNSVVKIKKIITLSWYQLKMHFTAFLKARKDYIIRNKNYCWCC